jgi:hypothetical protein
MSKLSKKDSTLLIVIGLVAVLGGLFWFYVKPARAELAATTEKVAQANDQVAQLQTELAKVTAPKKSAAKGGPALVDELRLAKAYPYTADQAAAILQFDDIAKKAKVTLDQASPDNGTDFAGVTGTTFTIKVTGRYFAVQDFIQRIHDRVLVTPSGLLKVRGRLVAVTKADLKPAGGSEGATTTTSSTPIEASITIVAFSRGAGSAAGGAPAPGQATPTATPSTPAGQGGTPS